MTLGENVSHTNGCVAPLEENSMVVMQVSDNVEKHKGQLNPGHCTL